MELREIIIILGLVAIVIIVLDGLRRMKSQPRKVKRQIDDDDWVDPEELERQAQIARELPNGGARIRTMTSDEKEALETRLNLRERVPMLMERVEVEDDSDEDSVEGEPKPVQPELDFSQSLQPPPDSAIETNPDDAVTHYQAFERQDPVWSLDDADPVEGSEPLYSADDAESSAERFSEETASEAQDIQSEPDSEASVRADDSAEPSATPPEPEPIVDKQQDASEQESLGPVEDIIVIHVMAKGEDVLSGGDILELLLRAGLRHGSMDIFHYRNHQGQTEFSLANCVQPGTFNPDQMSEMTTPGLTLFMQLPTGANAMESLDHMVEMARFMARNLNAVVLDETHSTVTGQRIESYREKLRSFARKKLIPS